MPKHYVYRMNSDRGFAPNVKYGICTLSGCKSSSIELWAEKGSWVIGIGGNNTGKPNKLIYAMEVEEKLPYSQFKKRYPGKSRYLQMGNAGNNVLLSRKFYYFGDKAIDLPEGLGQITIYRQGCKLVSDEDIGKLKKYLTERYSYGRLGVPNNYKKKDMLPCGVCKPKLWKKYEVKYDKRRTEEESKILGKLHCKKSC